MTRPSRDVWLMDMAKLVSQRATCSRAQVGVVIVRESRVLVMGYNGAPKGLPHCEHECDCLPPRAHATYIGLGKPRLTHLANCSSQKGCTVAVHAEANAIAYAARHGISLEGTTLYTTMSPCVPCAQIIINAGIISVIFESCYRITDALSLLNESSIATLQLDEGMTKSWPRGVPVHE